MQPKAKQQIYLFVFFNLYQDKDIGKKKSQVKHDIAALDITYPQ